MRVEGNVIRSDAWEVPRVGVSIGECLATDYKPLPSFWGPGVTESSLVMLYGPRGVGKSFFSTRLAFCMATDQAFLKWKCLSNLRVLYFDAEMGLAHMKNRFRVIKDAPISGHRIHLLTYEHFGTNPLNISDVKDQSRLSAIFAQFNVIFIDNLNGCSLPVDKWDDDVKQWARIEPWLRALRNRGHCVVLVHHSNKNGEQIGTSLKENPMDTVIKLSKADESHLSFNVEYTKHRHFFGDDAESVEVHFTNIEGIKGWTYRVKKDVVKEKALTLQAAGLTPSQIAKELALSVFDLTKILPPQPLKKRGGADDLF